MKKALSVLNQLEKSRIIERYAIGGAMAATFYVEPFTTFDLDVFVIVMFLDAGVLDLAKLNGILLKYGLEEKWKQWTGSFQ